MGNYPMGAEYDSNAPYNEAKTFECEDCKGKGYICHAYDIKEHKTFECSEEEYENMLDDEDEAIANGEYIIQGEILECPTCFGSGEIEYDDEFIEYDDE